MSPRSVDTMVAADTMVEGAVALLLQAQNDDGGWGSERGRSSTTEATAFASSALAAAPDRAPAGSVDRGLAWLAQHQNPDGSWPLGTRVAGASWTTAHAVAALAGFDAHRARAMRGATWLLGQEGRALGLIASILYRLSPSRLATRLDPDLKGWPWTSGTFSWVEPTAYALIALKRLRPHLPERATEQRIHEGELLLYDRVCEGGGWNYGNSETLKVPLPPYPEITALTLIALQDHREEEVNRRSLRALEKMLAEVQSGLAVSWSMLCFSIYGGEPVAWRSALVRSWERTGFLGATKTLALAVLAATNRADVFRGARA